MAGERVLVVDDSPTILKVVQLVLTKAGYEVVTAGDGEAGLASARERLPDVVLLDFVMPNMNGYQFCRELAADGKLKHLPVVLMSAKGDQVGERFVKVMGIVDYITKPFSPEAISAVVQHTIAKYGRRGEGGEGGLADTQPPLVQGAHDPSALDADAEADEARRELLRQVRDRLAAQISTSAGVSADAVTAALDDARLGEILADVRPGLVPREAGAAVLEGELRLVPIADVLQLLATQAQTGVLRVTQARGVVEVSFRDGRVDLAAAVGVSEEFLLGRFIVDSQLMAASDFDGFLRTRTPTGKLLGGQLVKAGYLSETELKQAIARQTKELVYEILRWRFGRFTFRATRDLPMAAVDAALGLEVDGILMEGFRRVDEWHLIEHEIENFDLVFLRNEDAVAQMGRSRLTREELAILELVNGKNSVKDLVRQSRMGSFDVSKMLYRLLSIKLIRKRVMPVAV